jgi:hypothetical protein
MFKKLITKAKGFWPLLALAVAVWTLHQLVTTEENFGTSGRHNIEPKHKPQYTLFDDVGLPRDSGRPNQWCDRTAAPCERAAGSCTPCSGGPEGMCLDNGCGAGGGWQNTVSRDCTGEWASHEPDGTWRKYQMPNYYGYGLCGGYGYGEPYYSRAVKY